MRAQVAPGSLGVLLSVYFYGRMANLVSKLTARFAAKPQPSAPATMQRLLARTAELIGSQVATVIDVGASTGSWSYECLQALPHARYLLVEANRTHEANLSRFAAYCSGIAEYVAASDQDGTLLFDDSDAYGGGIATAAAARTVEVPCRKIDTLLQAHQLPGPYLLKLDTHGFEMPILAGATECLAQAAGVIAEVYNHQIAPGSLLFFELCQAMAERGFRPAYLADVMERPADGTFWQMDILFLPMAHPMFARQTFA